MPANTGQPWRVNRQSTAASCSPTPGGTGLEGQNLVAGRVLRREPRPHLIRVPESELLSSKHSVGPNAGDTPGEEADRQQRWKTLDTRMVIPILGAACVTRFLLVHFSWYAGLPLDVMGADDNINNTLPAFTVCIPNANVCVLTTSTRRHLQENASEFFQDKYA